MFRFIVIYSLFFYSMSVHADECLFSFDAINKPNIAENEIYFSRWEGDGDYSAFLKSGEIIFIRYYACTHFGVRANLLLPNSGPGLNNIKLKSNWFASKILKEADFKLLSKQVDLFTLSELNKEIEIDGSRYSEFNFRVSSDGFYTLITIDYYFN